jgi:hypothetical protein
MSILLDALMTAGAVADTPGSLVRNSLAGRNPFQGLFSPEERTSGRDLTDLWGLTDSANDPDKWFEPGDLAGFGVGAALDPLNWGGLGLLGKTAKAAGQAKHANAARKQLTGMKPGELRSFIGENSPNVHWAVKADTAALERMGVPPNKFVNLARDRANVPMTVDDRGFMVLGQGDPKRLDVPIFRALDDDAADAMLNKVLDKTYTRSADESYDMFSGAGGIEQELGISLPYQGPGFDAVERLSKSADPPFFRFRDTGEGYLAEAAAPLHFNDEMMLMNALDGLRLQRHLKRTGLAEKAAVPSLNPLLSAMGGYNAGMGAYRGS